MQCCHSQTCFRHFIHRPSSLSLPNNVPSSSTNNSNNTNSSNNHNHNGDDSGEPKAKRARLKESISYADLAPRTSAAPVTLKLERTEGYYHGPTQISALQYSTTEEMRGAMQRVHEQNVHIDRKSSKKPQVSTTTTTTTWHLYRAKTKQKLH